MAPNQDVFLNVPFDKEYEPLFVALIVSIVALRRKPHCVLEIPDHGQGRLARIIRLMTKCSVSLHDLSRVSDPLRFNMPFELGLAVALARVTRRHKFALLEAKRFRLQKTLSDINGVDPAIHGNTPAGIISCVLAHLGKPSGNPTVSEVLSLHQKLWKAVPALK